jgi:hypothetical protein
MGSPKEYHVVVNRSIVALVALFGLMALVFAFVAPASAQVNGAPASVTSPGFGGRAINGTRPSVTSVGPVGPVQNSRGVFFGPGVPQVPRNPEGRHRHHHEGGFVPSIAYAVPVPYAVDMNGNGDDNAAAEEESDPEYQGGPTVFDRRGSGERSYVPPVSDVPRAHPSPVPASEISEPIAPEPTTLVFKGGRQLEVGNYAIVGSTLFDLTPGHSRKIPLADLDIDATRKVNDDRGVTFQIPMMQGN